MSDEPIRFRPDGASFFQARLVKGGPYIGLMTWFGAPYVEGEELDRSWRWQCLARLETTARAILMGDALPIEVEDLNLRNITKITEGDYFFLINHARYAVTWAPHMPDAQPKKKIDVRGPSVF